MNVMIDREELHKQVWNKPMVKLAEEYDISDVGLVKICKKLKVPRPPQGYWAKIHRQKAPALPPFDGPQSYVFTHRDPVKEQAPKPENLDPHIEGLIAFEKKSKNKIKVTKRLHEPHRLVVDIGQKLGKCLPNQHNRLNPWRQGGLGVCRDSVPRLLLILDAMCKALEDRGWSVESREGLIDVFVLDERLAFFIEEKVQRHEPRWTPKEKANYPHGYYPRYVYQSTGILTISIRETVNGKWLTWTDSKFRQIETCLNDFLIGLIRAAVEVKRANLERQREKEAWQKRCRLEEERNRQQDNEKNCRVRLEEQASNWQKAKQLREFVLAVEQRNQPIDPSSELAAWIIWSTNYANILDPVPALSKRLSR